MDNVIQNIKIDDIIPNNNHQYDKREIGELSASIKQLGLLEPITVREKNDKYELLLGNKRYQAVLIAGLKTIPAIIKKIDDDTIKEYYKTKKIEKENQFFSKIKDNSSDVINLSKLNKEYERDELIMNNNQLETNKEVLQTNNQPAFGERFFPSLEDEPTNMSFANPTPEIPQQNNFIDLTDLNNEIQSPVQPIIQNPTTVQPQTAPIMGPTAPEMIVSEVQVAPVTEAPVPEMIMPQTSVINNPDNNIINIENLKQNNEMIMSQVPVAPIMEQPVPEIVVPEVPVTPIMEQPVPEMIVPEVPVTPIIEQPVPEMIVPEVPITPVMETPIASKNILPVINTLKATAVNLENFGYTIRITDEDLPSSYKIVIEVEK